MDCIKERLQRQGQGGRDRGRPRGRGQLILRSTGSPTRSLGRRVRYPAFLARPADHMLSFIGFTFGCLLQVHTVIICNVSTYYVRWRTWVTFHLRTWSLIIIAVCEMARSIENYHSTEKTSAGGRHLGLLTLSISFTYKSTTGPAAVVAPLLHDVLKVVVPAGGVVRQQCRKRFMAAPSFDHYRIYWSGTLTLFQDLCQRSIPRGPQIRCRSYPQIHPDR